MPQIEVVIATHGRPASLIRCLEALAEQTFREFGVIVVDDASPEPVAPAIEAVDLPYPLRVERLATNSGPAAARNRGVALASAPLIAFVDDDVVAGPELLERHQAAWQVSGERTIVIGPLLAPEGWRPTPWNRWEARTLAVEYARMAAGIYRPGWRQCFTGNLLVPRAEFVAAGGFDTSFTRAEDIELAYRLKRAGCVFAFEPQAIGWHHAHRSLASWRAIPRQYARFDKQIDALHPELGWGLRMEQERAIRSWPTRFGGALFGALRAERLAASAAIVAARLAQAVRLHRIAMPLLRAAFEFEYAAARRTTAANATGEQATAHSGSTEPRRAAPTVTADSLRK